MRRLELLASVMADLREIQRHLASQASVTIAEQFIDKLEGRCQRLADLPGTLGTARPQLGEGLRSTPCDGYVIFFRYRDDAVEIINILHASRDVEGYFSE